MISRSIEKYSYTIEEQDGQPVLIPGDKIIDKLYYRYPEGNDIVSDYIVSNYYEGNINSAPDIATFAKDGNTYYFKKDDEWFKMWLESDING